MGPITVHSSRFSIPMLGSGWVLGPRVAEKDGRIRPDLSDWWLPGSPPCLSHAGVSLREEGEGDVVVLWVRSLRVGLACERDRLISPT